MNRKPYIILDFDSTFVAAEGLALLAEVSLAGRPDRNGRLREIRRVTELGMAGIIRFEDSLARRLALLDADRRHVGTCAERLRALVTPSVRNNRAFIERNRGRIFVVTGGFDELVLPTCADFGLEPAHVLANSFRYDRDGRVVGLDADNPLAGSGGKALAVKALGLDGPVCAVGDGMTDLEIRRTGAADAFFAFTENVRREAVVREADAETPTFDAFIGRYPAVCRAEAQTRSIMR